jgi:aspartyl-tRNA(Asn)/glutamyl-tRNA(Gln) amidotransferase subunit A
MSVNVPEDLAWQHISTIRDLIATREVSAFEVLDYYLERIDELDPTLRSFAHLDRSGAREQARRADQAVAEGAPLGALHGIPVSVKEHQAVAGMPRLATSHSVGGLSRRDGIPIARLRAAGALIIGTNTMMRTGASGGGYSADSFNWDAEARNPWDTNRVPGWSSSGGAAAVAAALIPVAIGTDGGGSTRIPAAYCGVVGVHPTPGLVPNVEFEAPTTLSTLTLGPLTRQVADAALVTQIMAGPDGRDPFCLQTDPPDYLARINDGIDGMSLAWTDDFGFASIFASADSPKVIDHVRNAALRLTTLGASVEVTDEEWELPWTDSQRAGLHREVPPFSAPLTNAFGPRLRGPTADELESILDIRRRNWARFRRLFQTYDLLLSPTAQRVASTIADWNAAWTHQSNTYPLGTFNATYTSHTGLFNWLLLPAISVPSGFVDGLPVGLQIIGPSGSEDRIFRMAQAFQAAFPVTESCCRGDVATP